MTDTQIDLERSTDTSFGCFEVATGRFVLPDLPFPRYALEPVTSADTLAEHHGKHHAAYVTNANKALDDLDHRFDSAVAVIAHARSEGLTSLFEQSAQVLNHAFFWQCQSSTDGPAPTGALGDALARDLGGMDGLVKAATGAAKARVGSGWIWLMADAEGRLSLETTTDADTMLDQTALTPLLVCDIWEHAFYLDHRSAKPAWVDSFFRRLVNWPAAGQRYASQTPA